MFRKYLSLMLYFIQLKIGSKKKKKIVLTLQKLQSHFQKCW